MTLCPLLGFVQACQNGFAIKKPNLSQIKKTKLLLVLPEVNGLGGIQRFNRNLISFFDGEREFVPSVISLKDTGTSDEDMIRCSDSKWRFCLHTFRQVLYFRPHILILGHFHFLPMSLLKVIAPRTKFMCILHGYEAWEKKNSYRMYIGLFYRFLSVSNYTKQKFSIAYKLSNQKTRLIYNTLPKDWKPKERINYHPYFMSVARLDFESQYKGIDKMIEAVSNIQGIMRGVGFKYLVVGEGNQRLKYMQKAKDEGIDDLVTFTGKVSDKRLYDLYANCAFFILPSPGEGLGIVFLEAMSQSKLCIGAKNSGTEDVIEDGSTGLLIKPSVVEIQNAIERTLEDSEKWIIMGRRGYEKLEREFDYMIIKERFLRLLSQ